MKLLSSVLVFATLACTFAQVQFAVVAPDAQSVKVSIGGSNYDLTKPIAAVPYFTGTVNTAAGAYHYIVDGVAESFERDFPSGRSKTYNDFFGRQETVKQLWTLGQVFPAWSRSLGPNGVFDDDYISTVYITGSGATTFLNGDEKNPDARVDLTIISKDDFGHWENVFINGKNGLDSKKVQIQMWIGTYHKRSVYKLRPSFSDPVFFREKLYNDILQSMGVPHQESSFARVYFNNLGMGLYHLQEDVATSDFVKTQFHGKTSVPQVGDFWDCGTGADFGVNKGSGSIYSFGTSNPNTTVQVKELQSATDLVNWGDASSIDTYSNNWFDVDTWMRAMVVEYLTYHWDSYWFFTSNFLLYNDPAAGKFYFIDQDFDQTMGVYGDISGYLGKPYTDFVGKTWDEGAAHRWLIDNILTNPTYKAKFESALKSTVQIVFNPLALGKRIDAIVERIRPDVMWDRNLGQNRARPGDLPFTYADFDKGLTQDINGIYGLKVWVQRMADFVQSSMGVTYDNPPVEGTPVVTVTGTSGSGTVPTTPAPAPVTTGAAAPVSTGVQGPVSTGVNNPASTSGNSVSTSGNTQQSGSTGTQVSTSDDTQQSSSTGSDDSNSGVIAPEDDGSSAAKFGAVLSSVAIFAMLAF